MAPVRMKTRSDAVLKESSGFKAKHPPLAVSKRKADGSPLKPATTTQVKRHLVENTSKENIVLLKAKSQHVTLSTAAKKPLGMRNTNTYISVNYSSDAKALVNSLILKKDLVKVDPKNMVKMTEKKLTGNKITSTILQKPKENKMKEGKVSDAKSQTVVKPLGTRDINTGLIKHIDSKSKPTCETVISESKENSKVVLENRRISTSSLIPITLCKLKPKKPEITARITGPVTRQSLNRKSSDNESTLYESALEDIFQNRLVLINSLNDTSGNKKAVSAKPATQTRIKAQKKPPPGVEDFDLVCQDQFSVGKYAFQIFEYLKSRESFFKINNYMTKQKGITKSMRAVLVDWLVEIQESFELNHETLYLAVKIIDLYLSKVIINKDQLQLLGCTAMFVACKYDERIAPLLDDFIDVSDRQFSSKDVIAMECKVLKIIEYNLGCPLSYRFLRRYSRCAKFDMSLLTLARYILELSLMEFSMALESDSKLAAAALYLALQMKKESTWTPTLEYYSGYQVEDFKDLVISLNTMLHQKPKERLSTIRKKYSHEIFHSVAQIPLLDQVHFHPHTA